MTDDISLPVATTVFPEEVYRAPETWARRAYRNLIYFNEADKSGHIAAWQQPELFAGSCGPRSGRCDEPLGQVPHWLWYSPTPTP